MVKLPMRQHRGGAERGAHAGEVTAVGMLGRVRQRVHGGLGADVAGGDGGPRTMGSLSLAALRRRALPSLKCVRQ